MSTALQQAQSMFTTETQATNTLELHFHAMGNQLPADAKYRLPAAIFKQIPELHDLPGLAINTLAGIPDRAGKIQLADWSRLKIRCPIEALPSVMKLAGQTLQVGGYPLKLGNPELSPLRPYQHLRAHLVVIKHPSGQWDQVTPDWFLAACDRQLRAMEIEADLGIPENEKGEPDRKTMKIKGKSVLGYSLIVANLRAEDSLKLQANGLGGKRRMGCGYFVSCRLS